MSVVQLGLLFAISTPFVLAVWLACSRRRLFPASATPASFEDFLSSAGFETETVYLEPIVMAVADALLGHAKAGFVRVEVAISPGIKARIQPNALRAAMRAALLTAIDATPGGQVLITGLTLGTQTHIRIIDDGIDADQRTRESLARESEELIALQGGSISVDVSPGRGTSVTLRLPAPVRQEKERTGSMEVRDLADQEV